MKKILLIAIIGLTSLKTFSQNITYEEIISGAKDHEKFRALLLSKDYVIESHEVDKDGYVTDVFYPIKLAYKQKDLKVMLSYKPNVKLAFINLNICESYLIDFEKMKDYIKTYLNADKTYFNCEKSIPPVNCPTIGIIISLTNPFTTKPIAPASNTATAKSITLPVIINFLNSFNIISVLGVYIRHYMEN